MSVKSRKLSKKALSNLIWLAAAAIITAVLCFYPPAREALGLKSFPGNVVKVSAKGSLTVCFIDVGQGDSALIVAPDGTAMLIDAGTNDSEDALKAYLDAQDIKTLQYVVFTHPHEDHVGGGDMVMENYRVENVIMSTAVSETSTFERLVDAISDSGAAVTAANDVIGKTYLLGEGSVMPEFTILGPNSEDYGDLNNESIVLRLDYGGTSFLFTGDAGEKSEADQLAVFGASGLDCDILKVGHHGSSSSTSQAYLDAVSPSIAVISCAKINDYGHPHAETLEKLSAAGVQIYGTYDLGTVAMRSDGTKIEVIGK